MAPKNKNVMLFGLRDVLVDFNIDQFTFNLQNNTGILEAYNSVFENYPMYRAEYFNNTHKWAKAIQTATLFSEAVIDGLEKNAVSVYPKEGIREMLETLFSEEVSSVVFTSLSKNAAEKILSKTDLYHLIGAVYSVFDLRPQEPKVKTPEAFSSLVGIRLLDYNVVGFADNNLLNLFNAINVLQYPPNLFKTGSLTLEDSLLLNRKEYLAEALGIEVLPPRKQTANYGLNGPEVMSFKRTIHYYSSSNESVKPDLTREVSGEITLVKKPEEISNQIIAYLNKQSQ